MTPVPKTIQDKNPLWQEKAKALKELMRGINSLKGTINCGHVALRLDEHLQVQKNLNLPPVPTSSAKLFTHPVYKKNTIEKKVVYHIKRSTTSNSVLLERCASPQNTSQTREQINLTEAHEILELDVDIALNDNEEKNLKLLKTNEEDIIQNLLDLPKPPSVRKVVA